MRFFRVEGPGLREEARHVAARFLQVGPDEVALVRNVTQSASVVLSNLAAQDRLGPGPIPGIESRAFFQLAAPSGTRITRLAYRRLLYKRNDNGAWRLELRDATGAVLERCNTAPDCTLGGPQSAQAAFDVSTAALRFGIWCVPIAPSDGCDHGATLHRAQAVMYASTVTIDDPVAPDGVALSGVPGGWVSSGFSAQVAARDNVSVSARTVQVDGQEVGRVGAVCDDSLTVPCPAGGTTTVPVDLASVADGAHRIRAVAYDPGGLAAAGPEATLLVDRHAPDEPRLTVSGPRFSAAATRTVGIAATADAGAPIDAVMTQVCAHGTEDCAAPREQPVSSAETSVDVELPRDGAFDVRAWLRDRAQNTDPGARATVTVGRDTVAPTVSLVMSHTGEVPDGTAVTARYAQQDPEPSSGQGASGFELSTDDGPYEPSDGDVVARAGHTYRLRAFVSDQAGNRTVTESATVRGVTAKSTTPGQPVAPVVVAPGGGGAAASGGTPPPVRRVTAMRLTSSTHGRRLQVLTTLPADATGLVVVHLTGRRDGRTWSRSRALPVRAGRARWLVAVPRGIRVTISARYGGDARHLPRTRRLSVAIRGR
jgi:hypothetical protein